MVARPVFPRSIDVLVDVPNNALEPMFCQTTQWSGPHGRRVGVGAAIVSRHVGGYGGTVSRGWDLLFRGFYRLLTLAGPGVRAWVSRFGLGNSVIVTVRGRRTGLPRTLVLGLIRVDRGWYLGHPNGDTSWTVNLRAAGRAELQWPHRAPVGIRVVELPPGEERRRVVNATWRQQPFPGNVLYWLARRHILAVGCYFRVELTAAAPDPDESSGPAPDPSDPSGAPLPDADQRR